MGKIDEVLDLGTWTETAGCGSVDQVICPHCQSRFPATALRGLGLYHCGKCRRPFNVTTAETPLGRAYLTEAMAEDGWNMIRAAESKSASREGA